MLALRCENVMLHSFTLKHSRKKLLFSLIFFDVHRYQKIDNVQASVSMVLSLSQAFNPCHGIFQKFCVGSCCHVEALQACLLPLVIQVLSGRCLVVCISFLCLKWSPVCDLLYCCSLSPGSTGQCLYHVRLVPGLKAPGCGQCSV